MAVETDHTQQRWADLGDLSAACITRPDTCAPEGAAIAFWVKLIGEVHSGDVFLTSRQDNQTSGFYFQIGEDNDIEYDRLVPCSFGFVINLGCLQDLGNDMGLL